ncbi:MAG: 1-(5-phosphoribosyl)-5-[(5-phosphoribosylamino)methylideneamino]imidazole-4-carboxamide isomerase [Alphaproteobacteria bacterium]|jgi:phosphoribosylformimino-5-aminoimidazole carboxamide ribotide isomerase|nr:1-(5-phosphoribosyl)-5-[(5-phosphoribosylamino)methylideneamino]imidazole-4-carboxamide isomerase [Alphaproteobacteria bacterium]
MIFFPAIDLKDGQCVRLEKGDMDRATIFDSDPVSRAKSFLISGCSWLHLVDLNGAFQGKPVNQKAVENIIKNVDINIQLGGGIRNLKTIDLWINTGINRVILGTMALTKPDLVISACKKYPGKIAVGIDAREGMVAVEGWVKQTKIKALDLVKTFEDVGVSAIIYTDINRDGILTGPAINETIELAESINIPVIVSGGVSSIEDIKEIQSKHCSGIMGVISGRAIYDNRIDIYECNKILGK